MVNGKEQCKRKGHFKVQPQVWHSSCSRANQLDITNCKKAKASIPVVINCEQATKLYSTTLTLDARTTASRPSKGQAHALDTSVYTTVLFNKTPVKLCLDTGAGASCVPCQQLHKLDSDYTQKLLPVQVKFLK